MNADDINKIQPTKPSAPTSPVDPVAGGPAAGRAADGLEFRRMLERLEEIARSEKAAKEKIDQGPTEFLDDLKKADSEFMSVMDMRRRLEEAYRKRQS